MWPVLQVAPCGSAHVNEKEGVQTRKRKPRSAEMSTKNRRSGGGHNQHTRHQQQQMAVIDNQNCNADDSNVSPSSNQHLQIGNILHSVYQQHHHQAQSLNEQHQDHLNNMAAYSNHFPDHDSSLIIAADEGVYAKSALSTNPIILSTFQPQHNDVASIMSSLNNPSSAFAMVSSSDVLHPSPNAISMMSTVPQVQETPIYFTCAQNMSKQSDGCVETLNRTISNGNSNAVAKNTNQKGLVLLNH
uniref:Uncharacterized protein n=1 Tax=Ditylenchus dipsaci TaxID=166011 RepID=A0A915CMJ7_9BILA